MPEKTRGTAGGTVLVELPGADSYSIWYAIIRFLHSAAAAEVERAKSNTEVQNERRSEGRN
ncbi:hypothetical protein M2310_004445 [Rhizobium leguminosarum]|uniref:Uncharacterized protein n=1 Tax=Rhizobium esperanzae TaxID=1967781 RepID=A0A7W6UIK6_9HYPH|nr:hypothetical protein [Rhizobium esperanzae]MDH6203764.1 hypothetical protein [Rhizobium leguminosarum]